MADPGPWRIEGLEYGFCLVEQDGGSMGAMWPKTLKGKPLDARANANHTARMDPPTALSLVAEIRELRKQNAALLTHVL